MYKYSENTLIHSPGVDFSAIESIMKNGIMSANYGKDHGAKVNRNYFGSNLDDTISCIRYLYVNKDVEDSAYNRYVPNGISFLIEDVPFISDKNERFIHRSDEVLVKDFIPKENIKGILVPEELVNTDLRDLSYIREDSSSYKLVNQKINSISSYIKDNSGIICDYSIELFKLGWYNRDYEEMIKQGKTIDDNNQIAKDLHEEIKDTIRDLNNVIGYDYYECFSKILSKEDVNVLDIVNYINSKTLNLPIYMIKDKTLKKGR